MITAILHANNYRDLDTDRTSGKRTLAVRIGPRWSAVELAGLVTVAEMAVIVDAVAYRFAFVLVALVTFPTALDIVRDTLAQRDNPRSLMRRVSLLSRNCALLLAGGLLLQRLVQG